MGRFSFLLDARLFASSTNPPPPKGSAISKAISSAVTNPRGKKILVIDEALQVWDRIKGWGTNDEKIKTLNKVSAACAWWLAEKSQKTSTLTASRAVAIRRTLDAAVREIKDLSGAQGTMAHRKAIAIASGYVEGKKGAGFQNPTAKSLHGGYANERLAYLAQGKGDTTIAAGFVHSKTTGDEFKTMSVDAYKSYFDEGLAEKKTAKGVASFKYSNSVEYLSRSDRAQYLVDPRGIKFYRANDTPADSPPKTFSTYPCVELEMYAMDRYGNLFVRQAMALGRKTQYFNHSSFAAGNEVICAGMIGFHKGTLIHIDNASGHYQPDYRCLHACLLTLQQQGIDVDGVRVMSYFGDSPPNAPPCYIDGAGFLTAPNVTASTWDPGRNAALRLPP